MSIRGHSTKETLLHLVDDIEAISKEMLESIIAPKQEKLSHAEQTQLIHLIMAKNEDLQENLKIAEDQAEIDRNMSELSTEVSKHDQDIQMLQKHLKEAETLLSTALYQARMKLDQISRAQAHSVNSEDLIRFAHRISSTNAVAAPTNWQPGDTRRPYPTDLEIRMGFLARMNELPMNQVLESITKEPLGMGNNNANSNPLGNPFPPWHPHAHHSGQTPDHSMSSMFSAPSSGQAQHLGIDSSARNHEDVEVMSSDSSSSSSSDSQ